ncbi:hypothetical protein Tco_0634708 [Tanacetum coccineum]
MKASVSSVSDSFPSSCIGMLSEDCSECSDSGSDLCIEESAPASLALVICHPVEEVELNQKHLNRVFSSLLTYPGLFKLKGFIATSTSINHHHIMLSPVIF